MPELPEVETIRRDLNRVLKGKKITRVEVRKAKMVRGSVRAFERELRGRHVEFLRRRGKLLIVGLRGTDRYLLVHLKMTGQLIYRDGAGQVAGGHGYPLVEELPNKYSHVIFYFAGGGKLYFNDMRQFGYMKIVDEKGLAGVLSKFGMEPLARAFTREFLTQVLRGRKTAVKNVLLDQSKIAGLGNIYADEVCFAAGIRPTRQAQRVTQKEAARLHCAIGKVLRQAVKERGTTFGSYRDGLGGEGNFVRRLKVYQRTGKKCWRPGCRQAGVTIKRVAVGGRSTHYCHKCQT
ncbi:MAG: bifunctional DNA-formamidopyrimidine glycosylase/DNA-(apurinic or apyrimidinic site) lyase [bacterium]